MPMGPSFGAKWYKLGIVIIGEKCSLAFGWVFSVGCFFVFFVFQWDETKNNTSLIRARRKAQGCSLCRISGASSDLAQPSWSSVLKYRALGRSRPARETACGEKRSSPPSPRRPGRAPPGKGVEWQHRFCMFLFIKRPRVKNRPRKPVGQGPRTAPRRCLPPKQTRGGGTGSRGRA